MPEINVVVNGTKRTVSPATDETLLSVLRNRLGLTGTKYGCGEGQCGACTVLLEGRPVRSCQLRAVKVSGHNITTIEGLERGDRLHPLQQAFLDEEAFQCGYCTPGIIMSGAALLSQNANPTDDDIVSHMNGNICRCGTYPRIVAAVHRAARMAQGGARTNGVSGHE